MGPCAACPRPERQSLRCAVDGMPARVQCVSRGRDDFTGTSGSGHVDRKSDGGLVHSGGSSSLSRLGRIEEENPGAISTRNELRVVSVGWGTGPAEGAVS